jgi:PAS domain S-box-containing protein
VKTDTGLKALRQKITELEKESADRRQAEESLRHSESLFRTLAEKSFAGIYVVQNGQFKYVNANAASYAGLTLEELTGKKSDSIVHPDDREDVKKNARAMLRGESSSPHEFRIVTKDGNIRWIIETVTSIYYRGKPAILGNSMDITEQRRMREALRESEQRLSDIIEFLPDATFAIDLNGFVIAWNRAMEEMTGVKARDITGKGNYEYALTFYGKRRPILIDLILKPDARIERGYSVLKKERDLLIIETNVPEVKGQKAFLWAKASPLYDSRGNIVGAIESIRDITDRKLAEEAVKKRGKELEIKTHELEELNAALRVLLKHREEDRDELEERMLLNIRKLVLPYLEKLRTSRMDTRDMAHINILESNLKDLISPFARRLSTKFINLTSREIQIANFIKEGLTSKEIADIMNVSTSAVNIHRYRIRKKMGITNNKHNLQAFLSTLN